MCVCASYVDVEIICAIVLSSLFLVTSESHVEKSAVTDKGRMAIVSSFSILFMTGVFILSNRLRQLNIQARFAVDEDTWPPNQPQEFTPLLLVHHESKVTFKPRTVVQLAGSAQSHRLLSKHYPQYSHDGKTTKKLADILSPLHESDSAQFILVEGLPGIGKTLLLTEIAYNWAQQKLLQNFKLVFLIQLRSPAVQEASLVADLFQLVCKRETKAKEIANECSEYLFENNGKDVIFLFDGYDEFPENLQKDSLVADILKRKVLPHFGLVVSSRPHASVRLRQQASIRVDVLGFSMEERKLYIEQALKGQPHAVKELTEYLKSNPAINGLCFIPFNMVILIHLYEQVIPLPSNSTQLYNYFITLSICRHLTKSDHPLDNTITNLSKLSEPYSAIVQQLSKLALKGINDNKLIFTLEEMKTICPKITSTPGAVSGFGLLQAVQHFGLAGKTMTFNFVHFSIQEFLAAYHITQLQSDEELQVLKEKFWSDLHANMFKMYISLTNGQRSAFKRFLSAEDNTITIAKIFLKDQLKCLRLFRSFYEASDEAMYNSILQAQIFQSKEIYLNDINLSPYDIECITLFLACSPQKEWKMINLPACNIQDIGHHILYQNLNSHSIIITELDLQYNGLTKSSSSIGDLIIHCRVEVLRISGNRTIGEDPALYNMLSHPSSRLMTLYMYYTSLSSCSTINLFTALAKSNKLQYLDIRNNLITDEVCDVIAITVVENTSLIKLWLSGNKISAKAAQVIVQVIKKNNTLEELDLPRYAEDVKKRIRLQQDEVNKNRERRGCQTKLFISF